MSTLKVINVIHPSGSTNNIVTDSSGNVSVGGTVAMASSYLRNRIINGDMRIDQRNAGASVTPTSDVYTLDRWQAVRSQSSKFSVQQNAASVTPAVGFTNYLGVTSLSAYSVGTTDYFIIQQNIEGLNCYDLSWGTANAKTITISFWVRSSLTGTFGGALNNNDNSRSYPFTYTVSSANTWEQKTITIAGDTTGTWLTTNGVGIQLRFSLGMGSTYSGTAGAWAGSAYYSATGATSVVGTNGATWYVTGVQLEVGSVATPFERRQYGQELALCQRYYCKTFDQTVAPAQNTGNRNGTIVIQCWTTGSTSLEANWQLPAEMRTNPTLTTYNPNAANANWRNNASNGDVAVGTCRAGTRNCGLVVGANIGSADQFFIHAAASAEL